MSSVKCGLTCSAAPVAWSSCPCRRCTGASDAQHPSCTGWRRQGPARTTANNAFKPTDHTVLCTNSGYFIQYNRVVKHALSCVTRTCVRVGLPPPPAQLHARISLESFACERGHTLVSPRVDTATSGRLRRL